jgi:hypothetical protein
MMQQKVTQTVVVADNQIPVITSDGNKNVNMGRRRLFT